MKPYSLSHLFKRNCPHKILAINKVSSALPSRQISSDFSQNINKNGVNKQMEKKPHFIKIKQQICTKIVLKLLQTDISSFQYVVSIQVHLIIMFPIFEFFSRPMIHAILQCDIIILEPNQLFYSMWICHSPTSLNMILLSYLTTGQCSDNNFNTVNN